MSWELYSVHASREAALAAVVGYDDQYSRYRVNGRNVERWEAPSVPSEPKTPTMLDLHELQKVQSQLIAILAQVNNMVNKHAVD